jgi:quercetin dioxygenase-like cupin family protein
MSDIFPKPIQDLPEADIPLPGLRAYLSQSVKHQILFMAFDKDTELPEHSHSAQVGFILEGKIELNINGKKQMYTKGDSYYIPDGEKHSAMIYAGYTDITFFDEPNRYQAK